MPYNYEYELESIQNEQALFESAYLLEYYTTLIESDDNEKEGIFTRIKNAIVNFFKAIVNGIKSFFGAIRDFFFGSKEKNNNDGAKKKIEQKHDLIKLVIKGPKASDTPYKAHDVWNKDDRVWADIDKKSLQNVTITYSIFDNVYDKYQQHIDALTKAINAAVMETQAATSNIDNVDNSKLQEIANKLNSAIEKSRKSNIDPYMEEPKSGQKGFIHLKKEAAQKVTHSGSFEKVNETVKDHSDKINAKFDKVNSSVINLGKQAEKLEQMVEKLSERFDKSNMSDQEKASKFNQVRTTFQNASKEIHDSCAMLLDVSTDNYNCITHAQNLIHRAAQYKTEDET